MTQDTVNAMTVGIDIGDQHSHFCVLDTDGESLEESRLKTTKDAFAQRFGDVAPMRIAIEASTHSPWICALLKDAGHEVIVANPRKLRMIFKSDSKNDRFDAHQLARVARLDPKLLYPVQHRGRQARVDQGLIKSRDGLVRARTHLVNHVRSTVKSFGARLAGRGTSAFGRRAARQIPKELRPALVPILRMIEHHSASIRKYDKLIEAMGNEQYPETATLRQVAGVGPITALSFVLTLDDPTRFKNSRAVGAFLGLRPKQDQSGERNPELRITKAGNRELRRLLVQCAQYILGPFGKDTDLRRFGESIAANLALTGDGTGRFVDATATPTCCCATRAPTWSSESCRASVSSAARTARTGPHRLPARGLGGAWENVPGSPEVRTGRRQGGDGPHGGL